MITVTSFWLDLFIRGRSGPPYKLEWEYWSTGPMVKPLSVIRESKTVGSAIYPPLVGRADHGSHG